MTYRIASNKRRGRSFNFWHFLGGVYSREAFTRGRHLLQNTEKVTNLCINVNDFVVFFYLKNGITVLLRINTRGVHLIFDSFFFGGGGGVYSREAFTRRRRLLQNTEGVTILYINVNDFVVFFYPKNGIILFVNHIIHPFLCLWR